MRPGTLLLASERSGTNLLRRMFDSRADTVGPPAPQLLRVLHRAWRTSDDVLHDPIAAADDLLLIARSHVSPWTTGVSAADLVRDAPEPTIEGLVVAAYSAMAAEVGASRWFAKENQLWRWAPRLTSVIPRPTVIHLVRDGRESARSLAKASSYSVTDAALLWKREQEACLQALDQLDAAVPRATVRYEDLIADPEGSLRALCESLDIGWDDAMLDHASGRPRESAAISMWANLDRTIDDVTAARDSRFDEPAYSAAEPFIGSTLEQFGYRRDVTEPGASDRVPGRYFKARTRVSRGARELARRWRRTDSARATRSRAIRVVMRRRRGRLAGLLLR